MLERISASEKPFFPTGWWDVVRWCRDTMVALEGVNSLSTALFCSVLPRIASSKHSFLPWFVRFFLWNRLQDCSFWRMSLQVNEAFLSRMDRCIIQWVVCMNYADQNYAELCLWEGKKQKDAETDQTNKRDGRTDTNTEKLTLCRLRNCLILVSFRKTTSLMMFCESVVFWKVSREIISVVPGWSFQLQESSDDFILWQS